MKKVISLFLTFLLSCVLLCACAVHTGGDASGESGKGSGSFGGSSESSSSSEMEEVLNETSYTVTLLLGDKQFNPGINTYVQWTKITETGNIVGYKRANFGENGIAFTNGLDGEYRITLGNLPEGYAYNPNLYVATGNTRNIVVEIYPIIPTTTSGSDLYENIIRISKTGVYRVTITQLYATQKGIYFEFSIPRDGGVYSVQSLADVMEDTINPIAEIYSGTSVGAKYWSYTCDGGVEFENGSYTKNFYFEGQASSDQGGYAVIPFAVRATSNINSFPLTVDFLVSRKKDYPSTHVPADLVYAKECPTEKAPEGVGEWTYAETYEAGQWSFDGTKYVYNEEDGFYHVGTADGPYLYVELATKPNRFLPDYYPPGSDVGIPVSFVDIENIAPVAFLRVAELDWETGERTGRMIHYKPMIEQQYASVCNSEGKCLVTKELRWFLQEICESNGYFNDGDGWVETHSKAVTPGNYSISALEDDQWLFACGYYKQ